MKHHIAVDMDAQLRMLATRALLAVGLPYVGRMSRLCLLVVLVLSGSPALPVAPRNVDMYVAITSTSESDESALRLLEDQARAMGWKCSAPDSDKPVPQRNPLLDCRDGSAGPRGGAVVVFHPLYESGLPKLALRGYRGSERPDETERLLRHFLEAIKPIASVRVIEVDWKRGER